MPADLTEGLQGFRVPRVLVIILRWVSSSSAEFRKEYSVYFIPR